VSGTFGPVRNAFVVVYYGVCSWHVLARKIAWRDAVSRLGGRGDYACLSYSLWKSVPWLDASPMPRAAETVVSWQARRAAEMR
jgi:hypothetical protein